MPATFQALAVVVLALLPGASYLFAYERVFGGFGLSLADRVFRFLAASAVFAALFSAPALVGYRDYVLSGRLADGNVNALWFGLLSVTYVALPIAAGSFAGYAHRRGWRWAQFLLGDSPEPRAWDFVWRRGRNAVVRIKLKSGTWLAGLYSTTESGDRSYASGYPEEQDLFLSRQLQIDPDTGEFQTSDGEPTVIGSGLLLRWSEIEYVDIQTYEG